MAHMPVFRIPNIQGMIYTAGVQPFDPGEPTANWAGHSGLANIALPWPRIVGTVNALANNPGIARSRAVVPMPNRYGVLPFNNLFIGGFVGKSNG